jgi:hypothetical protein
MQISATPCEVLITTGGSFGQITAELITVGRRRPDVSGKNPMKVSIGNNPNRFAYFSLTNDDKHSTSTAPVISCM